jgi:polyhydroxyalkanoate synthesis regulator phasin
MRHVCRSYLRHVYTKRALLSYKHRHRLPAPTLTHSLARSDCADVSKRPALTAHSDIPHTRGIEMAIKDEMLKKGMQMLSDPRVQKLMQNPQFMKLMMTAVQVPGRVNTFTNEQAERLASTLRLATAKEVKELRRTVQKLEREVARLSASADRG